MMFSECSLQRGFCLHLCARMAADSSAKNAGKERVEAENELLTGSGATFAFRVNTECCVQLLHYMGRHYK
jgi:hypothetical protein